MKINAIDGISQRSLNTVSRKKTNNITDPPVQSAPNYTKISFKGGNKDQAILYVAETKPYFQKGGVATVMQDLRGLRVSDKTPVITDEYKNSFNFWIPSDKVIVDPIYNGSLIYDTEKGLIKDVQVPKIPSGLPADSPFKKYEGKYFMTNNENFQKYTTPLEFFQKEGKLSINGNVFILEDVTGSKTMMDFGGDGKKGTEIKLFRVFREDGGKLKPTRDFKIFTDVTASWKEPYAGGGYSTTPGILSQTWKGDGDARSAKAFVELMPRICEVVSEDGTKFDPATAMLNDSQAAYATEYMAEKAAKGGEFWQGKKPTMVGHNLADGYIQRTSFMNMFVNIADKDLRSAVDNDPKYIEALKQGGEEVERYFEQIIPKEMKDKQGKVSPFMNTIYYAQKGYVPMISTVSEGYWEKLISDPDFAPGTYDFLKDLSDKGRFRGITNAFENVEMSPYSDRGVAGYYKDFVFSNDIEINGKKGYKLNAFKTFDKTKVNENAVDINHVREIKRYNKISLLERFDKDFLNELKKLRDVKGHETDMSTVIAGLSNKKVNVYGHIDKAIIDEVKKPNSDVKVLTSWGRGDTQKALDSVLVSFEKYVNKFGDKDPNTVLVMGGALDNSADSKSIKNIIERMNQNPKVRGRFVYLDGFAPNKPLASAADFALFPSRFAPCELTDLEAMKLFCSPIVTNCQGLAQKNFDATFNGESSKVTGYKTKHEYDMTFEQLKQALPDKSPDKNTLDKEQLDKAIQKFKDAINDSYKIKHGGKALTDAEINEMIRKDGGLNYDFRFKVLRPFRDQVIETELQDCLERALINDRNKDIQTQMVQNHLKQYTDWERNGELSKTKKSSAELYREYHFQNNGSSISEKDTLLYKLREKCKENGVFERANKVKENPENTSVGIRQWFNANKKASIITGSVLALAALGYAGYKSGWLSPKFAEEKKHGNLSCVG